jgi:hypothetical protein
MGLSGFDGLYHGNPGAMPAIVAAVAHHNRGAFVLDPERRNWPRPRPQGSTQDRPRTMAGLLAEVPMSSASWMPPPRMDSVAFSSTGPPGLSLASLDGCLMRSAPCLFATPVRVLLT